MIVEIIRDVVATLPPRYPGAWNDHRQSLPGEIVVEDDGSRWFHAYGGQTPMKIEEH